MTNNGIRQKIKNVIDSCVSVGQVITGEKWCQLFIDYHKPIHDNQHLMLYEHNHLYDYLLNIKVDKINSVVEKLKMKGGVT